jgi:alkylated DNA repair dioxygenase AlkB
METLIKTQKSSLNVYNMIDIYNEELVRECVGEVKDKLILNPPIIVYDKPAIQHRSIGFFSNTSIGYRYSNQIAKSIALTPKLEILLKLINDKFNSEFNGILVNKYIDGNDYIGAHSDDEKNLDSIGVVAISYGAVRKFRIRDKKTRKIVKDIPTLSNHIIHMAGNFQKEFIHEIPIEKKVKEERYSFTFRKHLK